MCTNTGYQCQCRWTNNVYGIRDSDEWGWSIFDIPQYTHVVAWMPLPKPYKEQDMIPWICADLDTIIDCYSDVEDDDV